MRRAARRRTLRHVLTHHQGQAPDKNGEPTSSVAGYCKATWCPTRWHEWPVEELLSRKPIPVHLHCPSCGRRMHHYSVVEHWPVTGLGKEDLYGRPYTFADFAKVRLKRKSLKGARSRRSGGRCGSLFGGVR